MIPVETGYLKYLGLEYCKPIIIRDFISRFSGKLVRDN